ncbi:MAG: hypothetical protein Q8O38_09075 [Sulfurimicrobium sp.]|nr:hypothetical protein [Sulfurimicrobium sp.]
MAKKITQMKDAPEPNQTQGSGLPVPFALEKLREMILTLYFQQVRTIGWMTNKPAVAWEIIGKPQDAHDNDLFSLDLDPEQLGLRYESIRKTHFAECIEKMYQFAYFGILDESGEQMEYESIYTWITSLLMDMKNSQMFYEMGSYSAASMTLDEAKKCFQVAELANARIVLEGGENFFISGFGSNNKDDDSIGYSGLTVRQMALLSGMEEMSIRAAANPKRANPLRTFSDEGRTRISIEAAKAWLQAKGRYVSITREWGTGEIDLVKRRFASVNELEEALDSRFQMLALRDQQRDVLVAQLSEAGIKVIKTIANKNGEIEIDRACLSNISLIHKLAEILELPSDLLTLRAREALAKEELASVERELRLLAESQKISPQEKNNDR